MNILGLDVALRTGWGLRRNGLIYGGAESFEVGRDESKGMRTVRLGTWLENFLPGGRLGPVDFVYFEQAHHRGADATAVAERFIGKIIEVCAIHGVEHRPVQSKTLKKWATGNGNAGKIRMIEAALNLHRHLPELQRACEQLKADYSAWVEKEKPKTATVEKSEFSDRADALCLLGYAIAELEPGTLLAGRSDDPDLR